MVNHIDGNKYDLISRVSCRQRNSAICLSRFSSRKNDKLARI